MAPLKDPCKERFCELRVRGVSQKDAFLNACLCPGAARTHQRGCPAAPSAILAAVDFRPRCRPTH